MKKNKRIFFLFIALILSGCASTGKNDKLDKELLSGDYASCAREVQHEINKKHPEIDRELDAAVLFHYAGEWEKSTKLFESADEHIEKAFTKSITRTAGAAALNENLSEYSGNIYETILLNAFNSLNYYRMGEVDEALVEIRRIEIKQKEYIAKYGELYLEETDDYSSVQTSAKTMNINLREVYTKTPSAPTEDDIYKDSAFAHYIAALLYLQDNSDEANLHAREYRALNSGVKCADINSAFSFPQDKARLEFVSLAGKIIERQEGTVYFPSFAKNGTPLFITSLRIDDIVVPAFRLKYVYPFVPLDKTGHIIKSPDAIVSARVTLSNGTGTEFEMIEWFDEAVRKDVAMKAHRAFTRSLARSTAKKATAVTSAVMLIRSTPKEFRLLAEIAATKSLDAVDLAETADIRQARYFPSMALGAGLTVPPGTYDARIEYFTARGAKAGEENIRDIKATAGHTEIVESVFIR